jgi:hypothetical protein
MHRNGAPFPELSIAEVDDVAVPDLFVYRTIVRRHSPSASQPPSAYERVFDGDLWEVWQRPADAAPPLIRFPLGSGADPTGVPDCDEITAVAESAGASEIVALPDASPQIVPLDHADLPSLWRTAEGVWPNGDGVARLDVELAEPGAYRVWVGGGVVGTLRVAVDGTEVGSARHRLAHGAAWLRFGAVTLAAGQHELVLRYDTPWIGGAEPATPLGPVALTSETSATATTVPVADAQKLCDGRRYDWLEVIS